MRDPDQPSSAPAADDRTFYVINLAAAPVPQPLEMPAARGLEGLVVFRSHQVQDGRHRYRLHLGYFETREAAVRALPLVLPNYPTAWIAAAPRSGLGSLDDTNSTDFRLIQAPVSEEETSATAPAGQSIRDAQAEAGADEPQRYAVQLVWSSERVEPDTLPPIAIFDAYTLYTVTCQRGGTRLFGVRLGFFRSAISAGQVAVYVRPDFPGVAVVPVSDREFAYASWLVRHRGASEPTHAQPPAPPPAPTQVEIAQMRTPEDIPLAAPEPVRPAPPEPPFRHSRHWAYAARRAPDLDREARIAALGAHDVELRAVKLDPQDEPGETLPEVRPFTPAPYPRRRSALGRLLTRIADRLG
jgi:hypothetical protein